MKILVIRFSSIGDIVLTSPVVRCLKKQMNAEVHFLTKSSFLPILENNPYIDKVHVLSSMFDKTVEELKKEKFDYIIDLHNNLRTIRFKKALNIEAFTFDKLNIKKWLLVNLKWNRMPKEHIVDRYLDTCKTLGVKNDGEGLDYFIAKKDEIDLAELPSVFYKNYIALVIGAQHGTKRLPLLKLEKFCKESTRPIIVIGGKDDAANAWHLQRIAPDRIINACGKYNLNQSASLVKQANIVVTHDTGMMHIAAAFKKEILTVWGNTVPEFGMYPYETKYTNFEVSNLSCRPCSKIGFVACPKKHFKCMEMQDIPLLVKLANKENE
jgi:ADP-heptose:LPS heptosyltransferase